MAVSTLQQPAAPPAQPQGFKWPRRDTPIPPRTPPTPDDLPRGPIPVDENPIPPVVPEPPVVPIPPVDPPVVPQTPQIPMGGGGGQPGNPGLDQTINDQILRILNQGPVTADDPMIKDVANAHRTASGRAFDRNRAMLAERNAAQGQSGSGGFETKLGGLAQDRGENEAAFSANLVLEGKSQRANEIMQALTLGQGRISEQNRNALTQELARLQAEIQREGMGMNASQFETTSDLERLRILLGGLG